MNRKNRFWGYVFLLLVACFSHPEKAALSASVIDTTLLKAQTNRVGYQEAPLVIKKLRITKDWIKVRYMGGDCKYDHAVYPLTIVQLTYTEFISCGCYQSFVSSSCHLLFKLRGPPAVA